MFLLKCDILELKKRYKGIVIFVLSCACIYIHKFHIREWSVENTGGQEGPGTEEHLSGEGDFQILIVHIGGLVQGL